MLRSVRLADLYNPCVQTRIFSNYRSDQWRQTQTSARESRDWRRDRPVGYPFPSLVALDACGDSCLQGGRTLPRLAAIEHVDWLVEIGVYLLVAWPGLRP